MSWKPRHDDDDWWETIAGRLRAGWVDHKAGMPIEGVPEPECAMRPSKLGGYVSRVGVAGGMLMVWPAARRVAVEGRLASLLLGGPAAQGLRSPNLIADAAGLVAAHLEWLGLLSCSEPVALQLTAMLPADGGAVLAAELPPGHSESAVIHQVIH